MSSEESQLPKLPPELEGTVRLAALEQLHSRGYELADVVAILGSIDIALDEVDRNLRTGHG